MIFVRLTATIEFAQPVHMYLIVLNLNNNILTMENHCFPSSAPYKRGVGKFLRGISLMVFSTC